MNQFRRLRSSSAIRDLVRETHLTIHDVVQPFFIVDGKKEKQTIPSMPGIHRYSDDLLLKEIESYIKAGGKAGLFFGLSKKKDPIASQAYTEKGVVQQAIRKIKKEFPELLVITDVCLCAYTEHGHCGVVKNGEIVNEKTLPLLCKMAVSHAEAGADIIAPSDMMDLRVAQIRRALDAQNFSTTAILSYAVKYASAYYGPFREAANSAPSFGDRKTYQMDPGNAREAVKEAKQDVLEGADMVMVKPAVAYLDVIHRVRSVVDVPVAAFHVSGEYSMIKAAVEKKWVNERDIVLETLTSIKRAGADIIVTYYAKDVLNWLRV